MSAFTKVDHHDLSDIVPFSVRFVCMSSIPLRFRSGLKKRPMTGANILAFSAAIHNSSFPSSPHTMPLYIFSIHSCSDGVNNKRHRVQCLSVTVRRWDRISCIQACHPSEVALRIHSTCCVFLRRAPPGLLDLSRGEKS